MDRIGRRCTRTNATLPTINHHTLTHKNTSELFLESQYERLVQSGKVKSDIHQIKAIRELDRLRNDILFLRRHFDHPVPNRSLFVTLNNNSSSSTDLNKNSSSSSNIIHNNRTHIGDAEEQETSKLSFLSLWDSFFSSPREENKNDLQSSSTTSTRANNTFIKGVYLHGGVGCGKTFCMNLFYDSFAQRHDDETLLSPIKIQKIHFHNFMLQIHKQMHEAKNSKDKMSGSRIFSHIIERTIEQHGSILCFDEFQVTDIADALVLRQLFTGFIEKNVVLVMTSNRPPQDLYLHGLQRHLFLPFVDLLKEKLAIVSMWESDVDYRFLNSQKKETRNLSSSPAVISSSAVYFIGNDTWTKIQYQNAFFMATQNCTIDTVTLTTQGRTIQISQASLDAGVAKLSFDELCRTPKGAADYLLIGENFPTVFVHDIPPLSIHDINVVRRFILFIDAMYESNVKLILHSLVALNDIFQVDTSNQFIDELFAFGRTRSRLEEMGSNLYVQTKWKGRRKEEA